MEKRLYKSATEKMLCGVCGGIAEYFDVDPTLVRLIVAAVCIFSGLGVIGYIAAAIIIPIAPDTYIGGGDFVDDKLDDTDNDLFD